MWYGGIKIVTHFDFIQKIWMAYKCHTDFLWKIISIRLIAMIHIYLYNNRAIICQHLRQFHQKSKKVTFSSYYTKQIYTQSHWNSLIICSCGLFIIFTTTEQLIQQNDLLIFVACFWKLRQRTQRHKLF